MESPFSQVHAVKKGWGRERWLFNTDRLCVKELIVYPGKSCSMHFHKEKQEVFYIIKGRINIEMIDTATALRMTYMLIEGDSLIINPLTPHRIFCDDSSPTIILESSTHHEDSDSYRVAAGDSQNEPKS